MFWRDSVKMYKLKQRIKAFRNDVKHIIAQNLHWLLLIASLGYFLHSTYIASEFVFEIGVNPQWYLIYQSAIVEATISALMGFSLLGMGLFLWGKSFIALGMALIGVVGSSWLVKYASDNGIASYGPRLVSRANLTLLLILCVLPLAVLALIIFIQIAKRKL